MDRLSVCLVSPLPPPNGGVARWTQIVRLGAKRRPDLALSIINTAPRRGFLPGGAVRRGLSGVPRLVATAWQMRRQVVYRRPDVVHVNTSGQLGLVRDLAILLIARTARVAFVYHLHFGRIPQLAVPHGLEWRLIAWIMRRATAVIALDEATEASIRRRLGQVMLVRIPNCVDSTRVPVVSGPTGPPTALFVGWVVPAKGVEELLAAWTEVAGEWSLVIAGPYEQSYVDMLRARHAPMASVKFVGDLPHERVLDLIAACELFVLPSHTEGFPNSVLEAMALGRAVIASNVGAIGEMLHDDSGVVVAASDVAELKSAMRALMGDPARRRELGRRARARVLSQQAAGRRRPAEVAPSSNGQVSAGTVKVCLVSPLPPPHGGIARWTEMISARAKRCSELTLSIINTAVSSSTSLPRRSAIQRAAVGVPRLLSTCWALWRLLAQERPDVVHVNTSGQLGLIRDAAVLVAARVARLPFIYHLRFGRIPQLAARQGLEWRFTASIMRRATVVVALDQATESTIRRHLDGVALVRIPNCVDLAGLPRISAVAGGRRTVLFVGWVVPAKGIEDLLSAWPGADGWSLVIAGPYEETYLDRLRAIHGPFTSVAFVGNLPHNRALELIAACEIFVLPSHTEGFPNSVLEAMALGRAIVATDVGAVSEMLADECGVVVRPANANALRLALLGLMADAHRRRELGRRARAKATSEYSLDRILGRYLELWVGAAGSRQPNRATSAARVAKPLHYR
jgi:glycosyltransferase involved in cell wall biosynthesis